MSENIDNRGGASAESTVEDVSLDLDTLEREGAPPPFTFRHSGRRYMLSDPQELDWQETLLLMDNPIGFLRSALPADDVDEFFAAKIPNWKFAAITEAYRKHYALPESGKSDSSSI